LILVKPVTAKTKDSEMTAHRNLAIISLTTIMSVPFMNVSHAETAPPPQMPSNWEFDYRVQLLAGIAGVLIAAAAALLFLQQKNQATHSSSKCAHPFSSGSV
jgi:hypothetical protein